MAGLIEMLLTERYGPPTSLTEGSDVVHRWNTGRLESTLYKGVTWNPALRGRYGSLEAIYGDCNGACIFQETLKVSTLIAAARYGLYEIDELQRQPEVQSALAMDPGICFFMNSANVWFYGVRAGRLFVYDSGADEIACLGTVATAFSELLVELEASTVD